VFPEAVSAISIEGDQMSGPFFAREGKSNFPLPADRAKAAGEIHGWYWRHAAAKNLAVGIVAALQLKEA
jgi:hypothetical protein